MHLLPDRVVFASGNLGKLREVSALLSELNITIVPQAEFGVSEAEETGSTFLENALLKARHAAAATGLPAIADDSGLAVDALDGRPGVYSARYAGPSADADANVARLLAELEGVADAQRGAAFHCAVVLVFPDAREPIVAEAQWRGSITRERHGSGGFGYDPVFFDQELGCTAAEMDSSQKNARSHRGKALRLLTAELRQQ